MIDRVIGVAKAYTTRVERATELDEEMGQTLCDRGAEFGTTTGATLWLVRRRHRSLRPHQWYGLSGITKLDVLDEFEKLKSVAYEINGQRCEEFPSNARRFTAVAPSTNPGWQSTAHCRPLRTCQNKRWTISQVSGRVDGSPNMIVSRASRDQTIMWKTRSTVPNALCYTPTEYRCQRSEFIGYQLKSFLKP